MQMGGGLHLGGIIAAIFTLAAFAPHNPALAEPTAARATVAPVSAPPVLDARVFALPYAVPAYNFGKSEPGKFGKDVPEASLDTVDLGKSLLRFEVVDVATRPIAGTTDLTEVIVPVRPGKKRSTPRYFGFTLTAPTH